MQIRKGLSAAENEEAGHSTNFAKLKRKAALTSYSEGDWANVYTKDEASKIPARIRPKVRQERSLMTDTADFTVVGPGSAGFKFEFLQITFLQPDWPHGKSRLKIGP